MSSITRYSALAALTTLGSLVLSALPSLASAAESCREQIERVARPYRDAEYKVWMEEKLYIYNDVAKTFSSLLDKHPALRAEIAEFKSGTNPTMDPDHLKLKLIAIAAETERYADSIANSYKTRFQWYMPNIRTERVGNKNKVFLIVPTNVSSSSIRFELGGDMEPELNRLDAGTQKALLQRVGWALDTRTNRKGFSPEYSSEQDYLTKHGVPARCFGANDPSSSTNAPYAPDAETDELIDRLSSQGRADGEWVLGFETSKINPGYSYEINTFKTHRWTNSDGTPGVFREPVQYSSRADAGGGEEE